MKRNNADVLATRIAQRIIRVHSRTANYLNRKTAYWSETSKVIALVFFCLLFGGTSLYLIIKAFF